MAKTNESISSYVKVFSRKYDSANRSVESTKKRNFESPKFSKTNKSLTKEKTSCSKDSIEGKS